MAGTILGSILGAATGGIGNIISTGMANKANAKLTREGWARDDTAVQRRAVDMRAAGINPLLAAGSAAQSSAPIPMRAAEIPDFGGAFVAGQQAETQAKAQKVHGDIALATINNLKTQTRILNLDEASKAHDLLLNIRRDTRSNDNSGLVNQIVQGADHAKQILEETGISNMAKEAAAHIFGKSYKKPKYTPLQQVFKKPDAGVQRTIDKTSEATRSGKLK
nr:MAG: DNA pilot protein [Microvirus sp.]